MTSELKNKYNINYKHNYFWDECWQVEEGYMIHPNFFGADAPHKVCMDIFRRLKIINLHSL